jgi:hypothetical protein
VNIGREEIKMNEDALEVFHVKLLAILGFFRKWFWPIVVMINIFFAWVLLGAWEVISWWSYIE